MPLTATKSKTARCLTIPEIKARVALKGMTLAKAAAEIGVHRSHLVNCLYGFEKANKVREKFAAWLEVDIDRLPAYTGPRKKTEADEPAAA